MKKCCLCSYCHCRISKQQAKQIVSFSEATTQKTRLCVSANKRDPSGANPRRPTPVHRDRRALWNFHWSENNSSNWPFSSSGPDRSRSETCVTKRGWGEGVDSYDTGGGHVFESTFGYFVTFWSFRFVGGVGNARRSNLYDLHRTPSNEKKRDCTNFPITVSQERDILGFTTVQFLESSIRATLTSTIAEIPKTVAFTHKGWWLHLALSSGVWMRKQEKMCASSPEST